MFTTFNFNNSIDDMKKIKEVLAKNKFNYIIAEA